MAVQTATHAIERVTYTVPEAAAALGVSERSVYNRIADRTLASTKFGRRVLIPAASVKALTGG